MSVVECVSKLRVVSLHNNSQEVKRYTRTISANSLIFLYSSMSTNHINVRSDQVHINLRVSLVVRRFA